MILLSMILLFMFLSSIFLPVIFLPYLSVGANSYLPQALESVLLLKLPFNAMAAFRGASSLSRSSTKKSMANWLPGSNLKSKSAFGAILPSIR